MKLARRARRASCSQNRGRLSRSNKLAPGTYEVTVTVEPTSGSSSVVTVGTLRFATVG